MVYNIKKNKNLIISSSIFAGINCNNIYCGCKKCSRDTQKNTTPNNGKKNNNNPSGDENNKPNTIISKYSGLSVEEITLLKK